MKGVNLILTVMSRWSEELLLSLCYSYLYIYNGYVCNIYDGTSNAVSSATYTVIIISSDTFNLSPFLHKYYYVL